MSSYPTASIFTKELGVGGKGGYAFVSVNALNGRPPLVQKISFWKDANCIRGVQVVFTDGTTSLHGDSVGTPGEFVFKTNEFLTEANLRANKAKNRLGAISFTTNLGSVFNYGVSSLDPYVVNPNVGSGFLVGISGRSGSDIDTLSLVFFVEVDALAITGLSPSVPTTGPFDVVVNREEYTNPDDTDREVDITGSIKLPITTSFETLNPLNYNNAKVALSNAKAFDLASPGSAQAWTTVSISSPEQTTVVQIVQIDWEEKAKVPPKSTVTLNAICQLGVAKVDFAKATVTIFFKNQAKYEYLDDGILSENRYIPLHPKKQASAGVAAIVKARVVVERV